MLCALLQELACWLTHRLEANCLFSERVVTSLGKLGGWTLTQARCAESALVGPLPVGILLAVVATPRGSVGPTGWLAPHHKPRWPLASWAAASLQPHQLQLSHPFLAVSATPDLAAAAGPGP